MSKGIVIGPGARGTRAYNNTFIGLDVGIVDQGTDTKVDKVLAINTGTAVSAEGANGEFQNVHAVKLDDWILQTRRLLHEVGDFSEIELKELLSALAKGDGKSVPSIHVTKTSAGRRIIETLREPSDVLEKLTRIANTIAQWL